MAANKGQCAIKAEGSIPIAALEMDKRNEQNINQQMNLKVYWKYRFKYIAIVNTIC